MMKFTKMHGLGNDYIYVNCFDQKIDNPGELARKLSDRHFGIGSDGLVLILPSEKADFRMRMFNSDGSEAEMCGNAIRCVGKFVYDNRLTDKKTITVETLAGIKTLEMTEKDGIIMLVRVDMGEPILEPARIPVKTDKDIFISEKIDVSGQYFNVTCVSMGNPHAIAYVDDVDNFPVDKIGPLLENHQLFPKRINAEFVQVIDRNTLKMRVWERGAGETMACGTGACAVLVASVLNGITERRAAVKLLGGDLFIEWDEKTNKVFKTGPATTVFEGVIHI